MVAAGQLLTPGRHEPGDGTQAMVPTAPNPADIPHAGSVAVGGLPAERAATSPAVAERHLPATLVLGIVIVLDSGESADAVIRRQSLADEVGRDGLVGLVPADLLSVENWPAGPAAVLSQTIIAATDRLHADWRYRGLPIGYFALHGCVGPALIAASQRPGIVRAVVGACGNPLDAGAALPEVRAPTLFVVDDLDADCVETHRRAQHGLHVTNALKTVADCRHVLDIADVRRSAVAMARDWFTGFLTGHSYTP